MTDFDLAKRNALKKAASIIRGRLQFRSPSDESAASWRIEAAGPFVFIRSRHLGVIATDRNTRHPLFGDREHWYRTNQRHPQRTDWIERAVRESFDGAADAGVDEWLDNVVATSRYLNKGP